MRLTELISSEYRAQNMMLHEGKGKWGASGHKYYEAVMAFATELKAKHILDYGCGRGTLRKKLGKVGFHTTLYEYDPAVFTRSRLPPPCDLVVCTDVLEHIEPDKLKAVLRHIASLAKKGIFLSIATRPANKILPDGRNAHLIIEDTPWWRTRVNQLGFKVVKEEDIRRGDTPREVHYWLTK
jgi:2-polyprenyl-3-methyl-5-hydroxy-6-metoxy-1,4-benzoquinol methylase